MRLLELLFEQEWFVAIIATLLTAITGFIVNFINNQATLVKERIKNERAHRTFSEVMDIADVTVRTFNNRIVDNLKKDGKFDLKAQNEVLEQARGNVIDLLSEEAICFLEKQGIDICLLVEEHIEAVIDRIKEFKSSRID